jgi:protein-disulfide isomerase
MDTLKNISQRYRKSVLIGTIVGRAVGIVAFLFYFFPNKLPTPTKIFSPIVTHPTQAPSEASTQFDRAVFKALERYQALERQKTQDRLYAAWQDAPESTSNGQHVYGHPNARFTLVEFSDFECPFCKSFHQTLKQLVDSSGGLVNWQFRSLPLHNPASQQEAEAAECVAEIKGNRGFWVFANQVFTQTRSNGGGVPDGETLIQAVGVDLTAYQACLRTGKAKAAINQAMQEASTLGVDGTPTMLVIDHLSGKKQSLSGAQPPQAIVAMIQSMMQASLNPGGPVEAAPQKK